jgi:tRNA (cytidine/uridine-2'-O-)-methyltransferase
MMNIVLHQPEIPLNTGNIGRTCVAVGAALHLIRPLGFFTDDKALKKAGMDYWPQLDVRYYDSFDHFIEANKNPRLYLATTKAARVYSEITYENDSFIVFGKESAGLPEDIRSRYPDSCVRIPMLKDKRSLNLANSVAVILFEALRQQGFKGLWPPAAR